MVPGGGIANGGSGRFRQINQIRALIEYNKLIGISILSSVSTETIAAIGFRQTWTPTREHQVTLTKPRYLLQRAVPLYEAHFFAILRINSVF
jgi:hypothetical protein